MSGERLSPARRLLTAALALAVLVGLPLAFLLTRDWHDAVNEDIRGSLPTLAENPRLHAVREELQAPAINSVLLKVIVSGTDAKDIRAVIREAVAQADSQADAGQAVFGGVFFPGDTDGMKNLGRFIYENRLTLFVPGWLQTHWADFQKTGQPADTFSDWLAKRTVDELEAFLERSEAMAYAELLPKDPWLLIPRAQSALPQPASAGGDAVLAWLATEQDALSPAGQEVIATGLAKVESVLRNRWPQAKIESGGVYEIARQSEARTRQEVSVLNIAMLAVIVLLLVALMRRVADLLLALIPLGVSVLCAAAVGLLVFGKIQVLALGISSVVLGLAVDYTVHLVANRREGNLLEAWRCIRKPLLAGCFSSCLGLFFLLLAPLPAVSQVGLMVPAGLLGALAAVRWILPYIAPACAKPPLRAFLYRSWRGAPRRGWLTGLLVAWLVLLSMLAVNLRFDDKIVSYQIPVGEAMERYQTLLDETGQSDAQIRSRWFTVASTPVGLLQQLNDIRAAGVDPVGPAALLGRAKGSEAWTVFAPQREAYAEALFKELDARGFDADAFEGFTDSLDDLPDELTDTAAAEALSGLSGRLEGPMRGLLMQDADGWAGTFGVAEEIEVPASLKSTTAVLDERAVLNRVLASARHAVLRGALWGFLAVGVVLVWVFGWRNGLQVALLPAFAVVGGLACATIWGGGLSLLSVIGAVLAYCLGLDYGAFAVHFRGHAPVSVRVSALTTAGAFAVLGFSEIKAVSDLGVVVAASVLFAWLGAECLGLPRRADRVQDH
ncbi:MAG: MMPL family transporter [Verrucomicrobiota bacterium JB024]|nr:MMPL family transporter [Verrucomicrobiota bacterium JB024]